MLSGYAGSPKWEFADIVIEAIIARYQRTAYDT